MLFAESVSAVDFDESETFNVYFFFAVFAEFAALTSTLNFPDFAGVPEISPEVFMLRPSGSPEAVHVIAGVPVAAREVLYAVPTAPSGSCLVVIFGATAFIVSV